MAGKKSNKVGIDMMNNPTLKKPAPKTIRTTINIAETEGEGSFPCPKCGTLISPDDDKEEAYKILETKVVNNELAELIISCSTCGTVIRLVGFEQFLGVPGEE